jgi:hypothetical protein
MTNQTPLAKIAKKLDGDHMHAPLSSPKRMHYGNQPNSPLAKIARKMKRHPAHREPKRLRA